MEHDCTAFDAFLGRVPQSGTDRLDLDAFAEHISSCPRCRGVLVAFVAKETNASLTGTPVGHHISPEEMAAFVDTERLYGTLAAANSYPQAWLHLLTCPDCSEAAQELIALEWNSTTADYTTPALASLVNADMVFLIDPQQLATTMQIQQQQGPSWSARISSALQIDESETAAGWATLWAQKIGEHDIVFRIRTEPAQSGTAVLQVNQQVFRQNLNFEGEALFPSVNARVVAQMTVPLRFFIARQD